MMRRFFSIGLTAVLALGLLAASADACGRRGGRGCHSGGCGSGGCGSGCGSGSCTTGHCGPGGCAAGATQTGSYFAQFAQAGQPPAREGWVESIPGVEYALYERGVQVGAYSYKWSVYRPYNAIHDTWGQSVAKAPIPPPLGVRVALK